jgi:hypothetical protein
LKSILGYSAIKTVQVLVPLALMIMFTAPIAGKLSDKLGAKYIVTTGMVVMAIGGFLMAHFRLDTANSELILPFLVLGLGMGLAMSPLTNITLYDAPEDEVGGASGVFSTTRQIGSVMGIAILGAVLATTMLSKIETNVNNLSDLSDKEKTKVVEVVNQSDFSFSDSNSQKLLGTELSGVMIADAKEEQAKQLANVPASTLSNPTYQLQMKQKQADAQTALVAKIKKAGEEIGTAGKQAFVDSINDTFKIAALIALAGALATLLFKKDYQKNA